MCDKLKLYTRVGVRGERTIKKFHSELLQWKAPVMVSLAQSAGSASAFETTACPSDFQLGATPSPPNGAAFARTRDTFGTKAKACILPNVSDHQITHQFRLPAGSKS